ncbi:hypothetical protein FOZ76_08570 [Verticiella sediminum]|uniref:Uncharacterized protein n=1 Tax=Verticiella sediminum TaxID=1247510 RepID=A0A556AUP8_9BURK|nr:hypothetical protein [Verticiella sediminum]TSH96672.1 hypothetical protein FOZ76_08570 [Verticiella sediminum]
MIKRILQNRMSYLSLSFALFLVALPLISLGSAENSDTLFWLGFVSMGIASAIPPIQKLATRKKSS